MGKTSNWSQRYRDLMNLSIDESKSLGLPNPPKINPLSPISDQFLDELQIFLWNGLYPNLYNMLPTYWGTHCQTLSTNIFAYLFAKGITADIVIGEVNVNGTKEYDTTIEIIRDEYTNLKNNDILQPIHAWVTVGDDIVIDAGLPDRLIKYYKMPEKYVPPIIVHRASYLDEIYRVKHEPLLVGTDFLAKTNSIDPLEFAKRLSQSISSVG